MPTKKTKSDKLILDANPFDAPIMSDAVMPSFDIPPILTDDLPAAEKILPAKKKDVVKKKEKKEKKTKVDAEKKADVKKPTHAEPKAAKNSDPTGKPKPSSQPKDRSSLRISVHWVLIVVLALGGIYAWLQFAPRTNGPAMRAFQKAGEHRVEDRGPAVQQQDEEALSPTGPTKSGGDYIESKPSGSTKSSGDYTEAGQQKLVDGDTIGALEDFSMAIQLEPSAMNYIFRGEVLMNGANFDAAIDDFDAAIRIAPMSPVPYYDRAMANIKLENISEAKLDMDRAIMAYEKDPDNMTELAPRELYARRAQLNLWLADWAAAETDYTAAISASVSDLNWTDYAGRAEARKNNRDFDGAISDYVSAVTIISEKIQKTPDEKTREGMSRQAMSYFEESAAIRINLGDMKMASQDLEAAYTLAEALRDSDETERLGALLDSTY